MRFELHCHSVCSDGSCEPGDVARRAKGDGAEVFCLTDHDTTAGYEATISAGEGMQVLRGLELSCQYQGRAVHILVYDTAGDDRWSELETELLEVAEARRNRLRVMGEKLVARDIHIDVDGILERAGNKTVGRPDVAQALVEVGAVSSKREAFDRYLRDGGPIDVPTSRLGLEDGVALAAATGARLSLAHPHVHGPKRAAEIVRLTKDIGLSGLETHYGFYKPGQRAEWLRMAEDFDLVSTGGSDFHGDAEWGQSTLGVDLDDRASGRLRDWLGI